LLSLLGHGDFEVNISVPLVLEYEHAAKKSAAQIGLTHQDIDDVLNYVCRVGNRLEIFFLWRPFLRDSRDDLVLEVAVESSSEYIVTFNIKHFAGTEQFGVRAITPQGFLRVLGANP
jgi:predicted nucleic acid-binding protein